MKSNIETVHMFDIIHCEDSLPEPVDWRVKDEAVFLKVCQGSQLVYSS